MNAIACSAPGKLFLGGEYAVLTGAEAVVTAVDRRATAFPAKLSALRSPLVSTVTAFVGAYLKEHHGAEVAHTLLSAMSTGFRIDRHKVGLGSSAAVTAAVTGLLFEIAGLPIDRHRDGIRAVAAHAHRAAQQGKGSGADVAAAVVGGTILFTMSGKVTPIRLTGIQIVTVWSGTSASTAEMIGRIQAFERESPAAHAACFDVLSTGAIRFAAACREESPHAIIRAAADYARYMEALGLASGVPIITKELKRLMNLAENLGGAAKPSGAGGGDIAVAFFDNEEAACAFRLSCIRNELRPLKLEVDAPGLRRDA